jgi:hypothetical protein
MAVPARLSDKLREALGDEAANEMVDWMRRVDEQRAELRDLNELNFARIEARFREVDLKFEQMDRRFEQVDKRFEQVDKRFEQVDKQLERVNLRLAAHDNRFDDVDARISDLRRDMEIGFARVEARIDRRFSDVLKWAIVFWVGSLFAMTGAVTALARLFA